jgi:hypothetical protein
LLRTIATFNIQVGTKIGLVERVHLCFLLNTTFKENKNAKKINNPTTKGEKSNEDK